MSAGELTPLFAELAHLLGHADRDDYDGYLSPSVYSASQVVPGCDHTSLMAIRDGKAETVASSDEVARAIDDAERALGEGPCLGAITEESGHSRPI